MSLATQIASLASRIASEFNQLRSEIASLPAGGMETGTSFPSNPDTGQMFFMSDDKVAYVYDGANWLAMTLVSSFEGGESDQDGETSLLEGGDSNGPHSSSVDSGTA